MIVWDGQAIHEGIRRYLAGERCEFVPAEERCVNEGAEGCAGRAGDSGWCPPCWSTIAPEREPAR